MSQFIIGFTGKIGVGKTTLSRMLAMYLNSSGYSAGLASFGDGLRFSMHRDLNIPLNVLYDNSLKAKPIEVIPGHEDWMPYVDGCSATHGLTVKDPLRRVFQEYSQNGARLLNPDVWVNVLAERIQFMPNSFIVIDDIRQKNELDFCKERGVVFRVTPYEGYELGAAHSHPVESAIDNEVEGINLLEVKGFGEQYLMRACEQILSYLMLYFKEQEFFTVHQRLGMHQDTNLVG
jgi:hypothetical protein